MIELYLNGKQAVLSEKVSIKLTRENTYFTKTGSYTYDIELPLQERTNRQIVGAINRKDIAAHYAEYQAVLLVDNQVVLDGKAVLHQVTDQVAKVQLMGGISEMNFYSRGNDIYVDELDLGDWYNIIHWRPAEAQEHHKGDALVLLDLEHQANYPEGYVPPIAYTEWMLRWWANAEGENSNTATDKGVMFPVINETASYREGTNNAEANNLEGGGVIVNGYVLRRDEDDSQSNKRFYPEFRYSWPNGDPTNVPQVIPSFQPMLLMMISKVLAAVGYPLTEESELSLLRNSLFRHLFIVTANNRIELNKALPHWTLNEFITQIEHLLGIVLNVNESTKKTSVMRRSNYWEYSTIRHCNRVVDEYQVEIDKDETTDISNGNIGFADVEDGFDHISEDIMAAVELDSSTYSTISEMQTALANGGVSKADKSKIFAVQGHQFIVVGDAGNYQFKEVNQKRALRRNQAKSDLDISLKIVPCPITTWDCPTVKTSHTQRGYDDTTLGSQPVDVYTRPDIQHIGTDSVSTNDVLDIEALIEGEQDLDKNEDKADLMYIGVVPRQCTFKWTDIQFYWPRPVSFHDWLVTAQGIDPGNTIGQTEFIELNQTFSNSGDKSLFSEAMAEATVIDTTVKHCIKFIMPQLIGPNDVFLIHGQKFACEKLEYNITHRGISPLVTGYFYRIED